MDFSSIEAISSVILSDMKSENAHSSETKTEGRDKTIDGPQN